MKIVEIDGLTDTAIERQATPEEIAQREADFAAITQAKEKEQEELAAKEAARQAVLTKLGLTLEEVEALIG
jgi:hypothetical protein